MLAITSVGCNPPAPNGGGDTGSGTTTEGTTTEGTGTEVTVAEEPVADDSAVGTIAGVIVLDEAYSSPDGTTVTADGDIYLNVLNLTVDADAAVLKIDKDNNVTKVIDLPQHPETKGVYPLGLGLASDGNLYVADNQTFGDSEDKLEHKSRLLRVVMKDGVAEKVETVATGMIAANGVEPYGDAIYVAETILDAEAVPHLSGVYRLPLAELSGETPLAITPVDDPHLVVSFTTSAAPDADPEDWRKDIGANGLSITPTGMMYVCNFGERSILGGQLGEDGMLTGELKVVAEGGAIGSTDGMKYLRDRDLLVVADFWNNAIQIVDPKTGKVTTAMKNANSTGKDGWLDKPSEPIVRDGLIYASNIDLPFNENVQDLPDTLSIIEVDWDAITADAE